MDVDIIFKGKISGNTVSQIWCIFLAMQLHNPTIWINDNQNLVKGQQAFHAYINTVIVPPPPQMYTQGNNALCVRVGQMVSGTCTCEHIVLKYY